MTLSDSSHGTAIGGYFQLEITASVQQYHRQAKLYQSARAAFRALLQAKRPTKVFIPKYICDAILTPLVDEHIDYQCYDLDDSFNVPESLMLGEGEWLLYVNYFGVCQSQTKQLLLRYPPGQIVFDFSQAFFDLPESQVLATIYSPRKFFGVPDGGMLLTQADVPKPAIQDAGSLSRTAHLLKRLFEVAEVGYSDYLLAEQSLEDSTPKLMSGLTQRLMKSIGYQGVKQKRMQNFRYLEESLKTVNLLEVQTENLIAPLCYPFMTHDKSLRERLIKNRVFVPCYWRDAFKRLSPEVSERLVDGLLPLPIDQRYGQREMERIVSLVLESVS